MARRDEWRHWLDVIHRVTDDDTFNAVCAEFVLWWMLDEELPSQLADAIGISRQVFGRRITDVIESGLVPAPPGLETPEFFVARRALAQRMIDQDVEELADWYWRIQALTRRIRELNLGEPKTTRYLIVAQCYVTLQFLGDPDPGRDAVLAAIVADDPQLPGNFELSASSVNRIIEVLKSPAGGLVLAAVV
jgi:hypothetical protein